MPTVALSFDDGPSKWTEPLLDALRAHDAKATFFVLGSNIKGHEVTLLRAHAEGHEIALHGWDHTPADLLTISELHDELTRTVNMLTTLGLPEPRWWRPPWHRTTPEIATLVADLGYGYCRATYDAGDVSHDADWIAERLEPQLVDGQIIGLHDGIASNGQHFQTTRQPTVDAVTRILPMCRSVTVSELLA